MKIFPIDEDPVIAAQSLADEHMAKCCTWAASVVASATGGPIRRIKPLHPWAVWTKTAFGNYEWIIKYGLAACDEFFYRFGKLHGSREMIWLLEEPYGLDLPPGRTDFPQLIPSLYRSNDAVASYRMFYPSITSSPMWTKRQMPKWWLE